MARPRAAATKDKPQEPEPEVVEVVEGEVVDEDVAPPAEEVPPEVRSQELEIRHEQAVAVQAQTYLPTPKEWEAMTAMALRLSGTEFVPEAYRGKPDTVLAAIATGRELGIGPMQSLRDIYMLDGRPAFSAHLLLAKLREGGVVLIESESTRERAWIKARRRDTGEVAEVEFTWDEASKITQRGKPLTEKTNYRNHPADMLWARCVSRLSRRLGSDLLGGLVYSKEEVEDFEGDYGGAGTGYDATTERPFDPGVDWHPKAIRSKDAKEFVELLKQDQKLLASDLNWPAMLEEAATAKLGPREQWDESTRSQLLIRWSNALAYIRELAEGTEIYHDELGLQAGPEGDALIIEGIAWAFEHTLSAPLAKRPGEEGDQPAEAAEASQDAPGEAGDAFSQDDPDAQIEFGAPAEES